MTKGEHQKILNKMKAEYDEQVEALEQKLVEYALEHNLYLTLGDYGAGRTLLIADDFVSSTEGGKPTHWSGKEIGDWLYSSETC